MKELSAALCRAQSKITGAIRDSNNPFFKSKYADLASVMDAIRAPFSENGLCYTQGGRHTETGWVVTTTLMHTSGETVTFDYPIICQKQNDPQAFGAATTYARRFALSAIAGVSQVDDDGQSAMAREPAATVTHPVVINENQRKRLFAVCRENGWDEEALRGYLTTIGVESTKALTVREYDTTVDFVRKNKRAVTGVVSQ